MIESKNVQAVLYFFLIVIILEGDSRRPRLKEEKQSERRDYRPSKWVANSAMDVWYGNKSMVDILSREFSDIMNRIALRPVRSPVPTNEINSDVTKLNEYNPANKTKNTIMNPEKAKLTEYNVADETRNEINPEKAKLTEYNAADETRNEINPAVTKLTEYNAAEQARTILLRKFNETISEIISNRKK